MLRRQRAAAARGRAAAGDAGDDVALQAGADGGRSWGATGRSAARARCLVNDVPRYACSVLTHTVRTQAITTIEGLAAADGTLHPVQQAVVDHQAFQCAFCMPGFVMATTGYLRGHPNPTRAELARGISGNLCRCGDYNKILNAMMEAAATLRS